MHSVRIGMVIVAAAVALWTAPGGADEWAVEQWEQTVYYRFTFSAQEDAEINIRLTAVDEYEVFFNGEMLGGDDEWTTMDEYSAKVQGGENHLAVRVHNRARGEGSGLLVELRSAAGNWVSSTGGRGEIWRWTGAAQTTDDWLTADFSKDATWIPVQQGHLERGQIVECCESPDAEVVAGFPGGVDVGQAQGGLTLRWVQGENLALRKPANKPELFDGEESSTWTIDPDELNTSARVDLLRRRLLSGVRLFTAGETPEDFEENSLRGYAVEVSSDGIQWSEVGSVRGIEGLGQSEVQFRALRSRHLRVVVTELNLLRRSKVAEIQVFGEGVAPEGEFVSAPLDLGRPGVRKNFERVNWDGEVPDGTELNLQFRSSDDGQVWSEWSAPLEADAPLRVPEPRVLLQYRIQLGTSFDERAPRLRRLRVTFNEDTLVSRARGWVVPSRAVLGRDTVFTYTLDLDFEAGDLGVERVHINTPSQAQVEIVETPDGVEVVEQVVYGDRLELALAPAWQQSGRLVVRLGARLLTNEFEFAARLWGAGGAVSLEVEEERQVDPASGQERSWRVRASDVEGALLDRVRVRPPVFSPNGDGKNDGTLVEFELRRVSAPQRVEVDIYDVGGRRVRRLDMGLLTGGEYVRPLGGGDVRAMPGYWDGRNDDGEVVSPGMYIVRLRVRLDQGEITRVQTVGVVY